MIDTTDGIAKRIGKKGPAIASDLSELASASILEKKKVGKSEVYFLNRKKDKEAQESVANFITGLGGKKPS